MIRNFIAKVKSALITSYYSIYTLYIILFKKENKRFYESVRRWAKSILKANHVKLIISGESHSKTKEALIYATNHSSMFDIPVVFSAIERDLRIIYKRELEKVPLFGYALKRSPLIAITRSNPRASMESMQQAIASIKENISVVIFPEGTRNPKRDEMNQFKRGAFLLASRSEKKIVPAAITGSSDVLTQKSNFQKEYTVYIDFLDPVEIPEKATKQEENRIMNKMRDNILAQVKKRASMIE